MKSTNVCEQLKRVSKKLSNIKASDLEGAADAFKYILYCEMETMKLYDDIKDEVLRVFSEDLTDEEFRRQMDYAIENLRGS
ncbi:hypothetical protein [Pelosinus sp. IPA-1]|uniref:hypothetical protein n=1 Tax=Pelosinus sp. IPA-1 TaxID=3029569 RepID=UPI0024362A7F|nr:hypothetical protein [Pelosinus sp. IPA-1]GMA98916.1 hypothetical protein PIPA1_17160 [Pelosinus sp. IPA-1]